MKLAKLPFCFSTVAYIFGVFLSTIYLNKNKISLLTFGEDIHLNTGIFIPVVLNNLYTVSLTILGGFVMATLTTLELVYNGAIIGGLLVILPGNVFVTFILPHAIFEIPAIIIAGAAGFKIPCEVIRYLMGRKEQVLTRHDIREYFTMALISVVLMVIAAWIEANVTLRIAREMLNSTS
ncbi:stage II sporulation protein M [Archaeoglobus neptunius]|uniref:stage II sporulation protein M n=1 Tax=Archaeoglobus neptunius TaxID=2798580 RepID=UPI0019295F26|nr:stage II sporulation protein M [Archaeoglobus neptunius]